MILDTTYILPLAQIGVDTDLLAAIGKGKVDLRLEDIALSLISVFELQAKAARLNVPPKSVTRAVDAVLSAFPAVPFYEPEIVETAHKLKKTIPDYVDCIIVATAISSKEDLVTEDSLVTHRKEALFRAYGLRVLSYKDFTKPPSENQEH